MTTCARNAFFLSFLVLLSTKVSAINIWIEGENGAEYDPILVASDTTASEDTFLVSWREADYSIRSRDDGVVIFSIGVPEDGEYTLWGRIRVPESGARPYDISFASGDNAGNVDAVAYADDSIWTPWAPDIRSDAELTAWSWAWRNSGVTVSLTAGTHYLRLVQRMGGSSTHIDKILLTSDPEYQPTDLGEPEPILDIINPFQSDVVSRHGQLQVDGNALKNANGQAVQLRGISTHGLQWFPLAKQQTIPATAEFFQADVVRLAMYVEAHDPNNALISWGGYEATPEKLLQRMEQGIEDALATGVYVIVDWHIHNVPANYLDEALIFFSYIAEKYGHHPNIIYEICNEPVATAWSTGIKPYAESVISAIRQHDPDNLIIVGTPNWSQDVDTASQDPLDANNILYAFHYYAATHDVDWAQNKINAARTNGIAVIVSEWGTSDVGTTTNNFDNASAWLTFLNENNISWVNWSLGNKDENSSILRPSAPMSGPWMDTDLSTSGLWLKPQFNRTEEPEPPSMRVETREAETVDSIVGDVTLSGVVGYFDPGDAIIYNNVDFNQLTQLRLLVSGIRENQRVEFRKGSLLGPLLGVYNNTSTGGWNSYVWRTFDLAEASGIDSLVMYAVPNVEPDGGVMNLDRFELIYNGDNPAGSGGQPAAPTDLGFDFETGTQGWFGRNVTDFRQESGAIRASLGADPQFITDTLFADAVKLTIIEICMETSTGGPADLFWAESGNGFSGVRRLQFDLPAGQHCTELNLAGLNGWQGTIESIRIDPPGNSGEAAIDSVWLRSGAP